MRRWCSCVGIAMGSYEAQVSLSYPFYPHWSQRETVGIDRCLVKEIESLWDRAIQTTGHCCGHNKAHPYIGVEPVHIPRMKAMGYEVVPNRCRPGDEDSFYPKSINYPRWRKLWRVACVGLMRLAFQLEDAAA